MFAVYTKHLQVGPHGKAVCKIEHHRFERRMKTWMLINQRSFCLLQRS